MVHAVLLSDCLVAGAVGSLICMARGWGIGLRPEDRVGVLERLGRILAALPFGPGSTER